jgi:hypothetical protein
VLQETSIWIETDGIFFVSCTYHFETAINRAGMKSGYRCIEGMGTEAALINACIHPML